MYLAKRRMAAIAIVVLLSVSACQRSTEKGLEQEQATEAAAENKVAPTDVEPAKADAPPVEPTMPEVKLTEALEATCLVKVGDTMPEGTLADRDGRLIESASMLGSTLTVLCFWNADGVSSLQGLDELQKYVAGPYAEKGVRVFGINHKDSPQLVAEKLQLAGAAFPVHLDPDGSYFAKFATEGLPRTYLLDANGKILWFDTEYSQSTKRDLLEAIDFVLGR
ncbi:MAG: TlpA family protein disulfide reductase [Pirellulaceae bacterium]|nr:TlpA family protein disulfide reductase [Pirellulaceae bacterium]